MEQETKTNVVSINLADSPAAGSTQEPAPQQRVQNAQKPKSSRVPAIIGIIIALILLALSGYVWFRSQNETKSSSTTQTTTGTAKGTPATATDVTATVGDIDTSLQDLDEASDFSSNDLSDTSLGL